MAVAPPAQSGSPGPDLPVFYYLENFLSLINSVHGLYDDLLNTAELHFHNQVIQLPQPAQALLVRLLMRRGEWFRSGRLQYREIANLDPALDALVSTGLISRPAQCAPEALFGLLTKAEWLGVLNRPELKGQPKQALMPAVQTFVSADNSVSLLREHLGEDIVQLSCSETFETYRLLYFGNGRQDLTDFILRDLGIFRFEAYPLHRETRLFESREQLDRLLHYYQLRNSLDDLSEFTAEQLCAASLNLPNATLPTSSQADKALDRRLQRLRLRIARQLERLDALPEALAIYRLCSEPPSRERQARILKKIRQPGEALALCQQMLVDGSDAEQVFAAQFTGPLYRVTGVTPPPQPLFKPDAYTLVLEQQPGVSVEESVADYFSQSGACYFLENHLPLGLFGMVFWPVIFADVRGAFSHRFQQGPHDLYESDFLTSRKDVLDAGWQQLDAWLHNPEALLSWMATRQGIANPFVHWSVLSESVIRLALSRIPAAHWQCIFERLWRDLRENRNGFPDLVYFPASGGYELVEVKGPGDRLQKNQLRWLEVFQRRGIPFRVMHVQWQ